MFYIHKYDPQKISDFFFHKNILRQLIAISKKNDLPHMLFYGPPSSGITTLIQMFMELIFGPSVRKLRRVEYQVTSAGTSSKTPITLQQSNNHIVIQPGSTNFDRHIIQNVVTMYARVRSLDLHNKTKKFKIVLINDADKLLPNAQPALRRTMELYSNTCKFILWCNKLSGVIDPIRSRCNPVRVPSPPDGDIFLRLVQISVWENRRIPLKKLNDIVVKAEGRIKKALWLLQIEILGQTVWKGESIKELSIEPSVKKIVKLMCTPDIKKILIIENMLYNIIVTNISGTNIIISIYNEILKTVELDKKKIRQIISITAFYEHRATVLSARRVMMQLMPFVQNMFRILNEGKLDKMLK